MDETARSVIAEHLGISAEAVVDSASFRGLGADSLDMVSLPIAFEEAFDLLIPDNEIERCSTVGDAMILLRRCLAARDAPQQSSLRTADHVG